MDGGDEARGGLRVPVSRAGASKSPGGVVSLVPENSPVCGALIPGRSWADCSPVTPPRRGTARVQRGCPLRSSWVAQGRAGGWRVRGRCPRSRMPLQRRHGHTLRGSPGVSRGRSSPAPQEREGRRVSSAGRVQRGMHPVRHGGTRQGASWGSGESLRGSPGQLRQQASLHPPREARCGGAVVGLGREGACGLPRAVRDGREAGGWGCRGAPRTGGRSSGSPRRSLGLL